MRGSTRRIGCITYTNTAVSEIESRLRRFGARDDELYFEISTIHSFCLNHVLRPFHYLLPEFTGGFEVLASDDDRWKQLVATLIARHRIDRRQSDDFERVERLPDGAISAPLALRGPAAEEFIQFLDANSFITFAEMVYHSLRIVKQAPVVASGLASRFTWLIIDEFQDTTAGQVELFKTIADYGRTQFFIVGDPNQAIMSFAGGHPRLMDDFAEHIAARRDICLRGNYRCSKRIVAHAEKLCPSIPPMQALGDSRDYPAEPEYIHAQSIVDAVFHHFIPALEAANINLGEAAVLAPWWVKLLTASQELRRRGVPMIGPGARPYRRSRDFAQFAEHACAYALQPDAQISCAAQRALFLLMLLNILGTPEWRVYSYDGCRSTLSTLPPAKQIGQQTEGAVNWLRTAASYSQMYLSLMIFCLLQKSTSSRSLRRRWLAICSVTRWILSILASPISAYMLVLDNA